MLNEPMVIGIEDPLESLHNTMVFDPRDWALNKRDAWIYAIVVGWGDALEEVAAGHGWAEKDVERLKMLREKFVELRGTT